MGTGTGRNMLELVRCTKCGGKMSRRERDLICNCGHAFKFNNYVYNINFDEVDKGQYSDLYTEDYYNCPFYDYSSYRLERIVALAKPNSRKRILDLGCGPGEIAVRCAIQGAEVFGIDISQDALKLSARRAELNNVKVNLFEFDGRNVPFTDSTFDSIIISDVVEHVDDQILDCLIKECYRLLKPDGYVVIHTSPTKNIIQLTKMLKKLSMNRIDLYSRLITPEYEHLHIRYHDARSLRTLLRRNNFYPAMWGEFQYLQDLPHVLKKISMLSDQIWCMAYKDPKLLNGTGNRPYLSDVPSELEMGKGDSLYINYGLYDAEEGFRWTAKRASIFIRVRPNSSKLVLELFSSQPKVGAKLSLGKHLISRFTLEKGMHHLSIPLNNVEQGVQEMKLELDSTFVPKEEGINQDTRELGVAICRLSVE
jgi:2-polyprenyl-3-methyl-5-hydroxy-6-metoxy-1,4-benzoquinol methylase